MGAKASRPCFWAARRGRFSHTRRYRCWSCGDEPLKLVFLNRNAKKNLPQSSTKRLISPLSVPHNGAVSIVLPERRHTPPNPPPLVELKRNLQVALFFGATQTLSPWLLRCTIFYGSDFTVLGPNQSVSCLKQAVSSRLRLRPLTGPFEPLCYTRATESYAGRLPWPLASTSREHVVSTVGCFARLKFGCCDAVLAGCGKRPVRLLIVWRFHTCTVHIPACPRRRHHENSRISGQGNHP